MRGSCARRSAPARPGSRRASRSRTAASTASRSRAASPSRRGRGAVPRRRRGRQGRGAHHAGRAVHLRRRLRVAAARRPAVHLPAVRGARRQAPRAGRGCTSRACAHGAQVWPQVTPRPLTMQFTIADPYSLNTGAGVRRADEGEPRRAPRGVPRPGVARAGRGRPRGVADEAALGDVRGLGVAAVPRAAGPAGERPRRASAAAARST